MLLDQIGLEAAHLWRICLFRHELEELILFLSIVDLCLDLRGLVRLLLNEASEVVPGRSICVLLEEWELLRRLLRLGLLRLLFLIAVEQSALRFKEFDLLSVIISWYGEEDRVLEAKGAVGDEAFLDRLFDHGRLLPDLIHCSLLMCGKKPTLHSSKDHILLLLLGIFRILRRILLSRIILLVIIRKRACTTEVVFLGAHI